MVPSELGRFPGKGRETNRDGNHPQLEYFPGRGELGAVIRSSSTTRLLRLPSSGGDLLVREWPSPPEARGTVLVLHGLGDHSGFHEWAAALFAEQGWRTVSFDWPGNGGSHGVRGDLPRVERAATLISEFLEETGLLPVGILAHSTGAFLILPWLAEFAAPSVRERLQWLWLSSPLLRPSHGQPIPKILVARTLARFFPRFTISNGVRARDCYHVVSSSAAETDWKCDGGHHRVALGFAADLVAWEGRIESLAAKLPPDLAVLLTQGAEDRICPPEHALRFFEIIVGEKTFVLASGSRHEPHREPHRSAMIAAVRAWLDRRNDRVL